MHVTLCRGGGWLPSHAPSSSVAASQHSKPKQQGAKWLPTSSRASTTRRGTKRCSTAAFGRRKGQKETKQRERLPPLLSPLLWTRAKTIRKLTMKRTKHLAPACKHQGEDRSKFKFIRAQPAEVAVGLIIRLCQQAWTCAKCRCGLPLRKVPMWTPFDGQTSFAQIRHPAPAKSSKSGQVIACAWSMSGMESVRATTIICSTCTSSFERVGAVASGTCKGRGFRKPLLRPKRKMMAKIPRQRRPQAALSGLGARSVLPRTSFPSGSRCPPHAARLA